MASPLTSHEKPNDMMARVSNQNSHGVTCLTDGD